MIEVGITRAIHAATLVPIDESTGFAGGRDAGPRVDIADPDLLAALPTLSRLSGKGANDIKIPGVSFPPSRSTYRIP